VEIFNSFIIGLLQKMNVLMQHQGNVFIQERGFEDCMNMYNDTISNDRVHCYLDYQSQYGFES
jgi:hypothetical protein